MIHTHIYTDRRTSFKQHLIVNKLDSQKGNTNSFYLTISSIISKGTTKHCFLNNLQNFSYFSYFSNTVSYDYRHKYRNKYPRHTLLSSQVGQGRENCLWNEADLIPTPSQGLRQRMNITFPPDNGMTAPHTDQRKLKEASVNVHRIHPTCDSKRVGRGKRDAHNGFAKTIKLYSLPYSKLVVGIFTHCL